MSPETRKPVASSAQGAGGSGNNSDEIRYRSYLTQLERQQDADIKDKEVQHKDRVTKVIGSQTEQEQQLHKDYDVKISAEAENLDRRLGLIRERNSILISQERDLGQHEADKVKMQYQQKIEQEKHIGDEQLGRLQQYYKRAAEELATQNDKKVKPSQKGTTA